jgi:hypothetical protein
VEGGEQHGLRVPEPEEGVAGGQRQPIPSHVIVYIGAENSIVLKPYQVRRPSNKLWARLGDRMEIQRFMDKIISATLSADQTAGREGSGNRII